MGIKLNGDLTKDITYNSNTPTTVNFVSGSISGIIFTKAELLWSNPNPTSSLSNSSSSNFASFDVNQNMYTYFLIEYANYRSWGSQYRLYRVDLSSLPVISFASIHIFSLWSVENGFSKSRHLRFDITRDTTTHVGVTIKSLASHDANTSRSSPSSSTAVCIPRKIYGVFL